MLNSIETRVRVSSGFGPTSQAWRTYPSEAPEATSQVRALGLPTIGKSSVPDGRLDPAIGKCCRVGCRSVQLAGTSRCGNVRVQPPSRATRTRCGAASQALPPRHTRRVCEAARTSLRLRRTGDGPSHRRRRRAVARRSVTRYVKRQLSEAASWVTASGLD